MNKKGFTLIELLAIIVILGILLLIAVPKINNVIENTQRGAYKSTNSMIVSELGRQNGLEITPQVYTFTDGVMSPDIGITGELPKNGTIEINNLGQIQVVTSNDKYCAIKRFDEDNVAIFDAGERNCNVIVEITLTVNPNGGTYEGSTSNTTYSVPTEDFQTINDPTRDGYIFDGWTIEGEGTYSSWLFQAGYTDSTLTAKWLEYSSLTVNLGGGAVTSQIFDPSYLAGTVISLVEPTRSGYVFNNWSVAGTGSSISGTTFTMGTANATLTANWLAYSDMFTYTGSKTVIDDGSGNWRIKFLTSGTLNFKVDIKTDVFLVGGGGGGSSNYGKGGGGGYTATYISNQIVKNTNYNIVIGSGGSGGSPGNVGTSGGASSGFGYTANGGVAGGLNGNGGNGGSGGGTCCGGIGGSDGSNGNPGGTGQGSTTREFGESTATLYAGGGGGEGSGGAASGSTPNLGGGGSGSQSIYWGENGGSGIVVIRNSKISQVGNTVKYKFSYSGSYLIENGNTDNWKIKFLTSGTFLPFSNMKVDVFLVGGGGGGSSNYGKGGGGGYTSTYIDKSITLNTTYNIVVGIAGIGGNAGGYSGGSGGLSSAFGYSVNGGGGGATSSGGNGGSGGSGGGACQGTGGSDGSNGNPGNWGGPGLGQGSTTREFGESTGTLYAGGGGGETSGGAASGSTPNLGGGGNGSTNDYKAENGGSGIVVIRPS